MAFRQKLQNKYWRSLISSQSKSDDLKTKEEAYIEKVEQIILEYLEELDLSIYDLAHKLHLNRPQMHPKTNALSRMSAAIYLHHIRLQKVKKMHVSSGLIISEIDYQTRFKSPAYFSHVFK